MNEVLPMIRWPAEAAGTWRHPRRLKLALSTTEVLKSITLPNYSVTTVASMRTFLYTSFSGDEGRRGVTAADSDQTVEPD